jgi:hypothetical protein
LPQLQALPSFIGQFFPLLLQLSLSAAKEAVQTIAAKTAKRMFV